MPTTRYRKPQSPRGAALAKIHIAAADLGMIRDHDDDTYRAMLYQVAGVTSARDLDDAGIDKVLKHLRACGWQEPSFTGTRARYEKGSQAALIRWLWTQLARAGHVQDSSDRALRRYIGQHGGIEPQANERDPRHLDRRQAHKVIEQLKRWLERKPKAEQ